MEKYIYCEIFDGLIVACYQRRCEEASMTYHYQLISQHCVETSFDSADYKDAQTAYRLFDY